MKICHSTEKIIVCIQPLGWLSLGAINLGTFQLWRNLTNDTFGYLVLETKDIFQISLGATRPKLSPSAGIDQLTSDPYLVLRFAYAAFEHVADPELATNLLNIDRFAFVSKAGIAGDDEEPANAR